MTIAFASGVLHCAKGTAHQRPHKPLKRPVRAAHHLDLLRRLWPVLARLRGIDALKVERDENDRKVNVVIPAERCGLIFIFRTFERIAYALVVQSEGSVEVNDFVRTP